MANQLTDTNTSPAIYPTDPLTGISPSATNPNSQGVNDISDVRPTSTLVNLPIRAEKRLIPTNVSADLIQETFDNGLEGLGIDPSTVQSNFVKSSDFFTYANTEAKRLQNAVDFIKIRIPHRGVNPSSLLPDPTQAVTYKFLVNPATLTVNRQTVDSQSLTRGGWQFGVWGEDTFMVQMQGTSAGSYFSLGLTDEFSYYAVSYRNLMQLQEVFENNGYWFEGEEYNEGPLAADYLRRRIRMHQDVELWCGNFIWSGMFDSFSISQEADHPFMLNFTLSFFAWKERYRSTSPYWDSIPNNVQRGHSYSVVEGSNGNIQNNNNLSQFAPAGTDFQSSQVNSTLSTGASAPYANNPAVQSSAADDISQQPMSPIESDSIGYQPLQNLTSPDANSSFWQGGGTSV